MKGRQRLVLQEVSLHYQENLVKRKVFLTRICDLKIEHRELAVVHTRSKTKSLYIIQGPPEQLEEVMVDKIGIKQRKRFGFPVCFTSSAL